MSDNLDKLDTADLQQRRANAYYTYCMCGGHTKSHMNKILLAKYDAELSARGLTPNEDLDGIFNGPGST